MSLEMSLLLIISLAFVERDPRMQILTDRGSIDDNFTCNQPMTVLLCIFPLLAISSLNLL